MELRLRMHTFVKQIAAIYFSEYIGLEEVRNSVIYENVSTNLRPSHLTHFSIKVTDMSSNVTNNVLIVCDRMSINTLCSAKNQAYYKSH